MGLYGGSEAEQQDLQGVGVAFDPCGHCHPSLLKGSSALKHKSSAYTRGRQNHFRNKSYLSFEEYVAFDKIFFKTKFLHPLRPEITNVISCSTQALYL